MMPFTRYIVSILLALVFANGVVAQDSLQVKPVEDSVIVHPKEKRTAIILGTDYGKLAPTAFNLDTKYEFNASLIVFKRLRINIDFGHGALQPKNAIENGSYTSTGDYYRGGLDYQFELAPKTYLALGGMYATSKFSDEGNVQIQSDIWPSLNQSFMREDFTAQWAEFVLTSEKTFLNRESGFFANLYVGIKLRLRFLIERPKPENFDIYAIPGYGRTFNNVVPAANLFVAYRIEL